jgi:hypothetical protein
LPEDEFHAIAEVTQDSMVDGFLDFSPEDTVDIITAIAEGATPHLNTDAVYSKKKVKSVQMESKELKEVVSLVSQGGPKTFKQEMGTRKKKVFKHGYAVPFATRRLDTRGSSSQPESLRFFIPEEEMRKYMEFLHHNMNHMGRNKLSATASKYVLGPRMYQAANSVVSSCTTCLQCIDAVRQNSPPSEPTRAMIP